MIPARVGARGWTCGSHHAKLPPELDNHAPVEVVRINGREVIVRGASGRESPLWFHQLDCGHEYRGRSGNWVHESDPRVQAALRAGLERVRSQTFEPALSADMAAYVDVRWVIERNTRRESFNHR